MIAVNLLDIFGKKKKKKQEQSVQSNKTQVSNNKVAPIAPVNSSNTTKKILGVQTQNSSIAPIATNKQDVLNKLKAQNEEKLNQAKNKKTDWIDSLKDGYDFGDITKTVLGTVGFGEYSRNDKPMEIDTESIAKEYSGYNQEQLQKEQKKIQQQILKYSKGGAKAAKDKDGHYTLSGVWNTMTGSNAKKLQNDKEYQTLLQRDNVLIEMLQEAKIKNKKYDKGFAGFAEKSNDVIVGGMAKGARGIEGTVKKILGQEDTISEKTYAEKYSEKAISQANGKVEKAALEMQSSMGQMVPQMVVPAGKASTAVGFANYGGSAYNDAKEQGYTEEQATLYGIVNGTLETALNKVLPSFKVGGKNVYGKTATDNLIKKIMTKTIGNEAFKRWIIDASGEFTEEYLQEFLDPIVREVILKENNGLGMVEGKNALKITENIAKSFFSKENLHAGLLGALNSGLMGAPSAVRSNAYTKATGRSAETGLTQNEQAVVDSIVENRKAELKEKNGKVTKKDISKIEQEVRQDLERGYIEINDIERALSNEEWTKHDNVVKQKEKLENQIKELENKTPQDYKTMGEINSSNEELSRLKEQLKAIDTNTTRNELNSAMNGKITDNDTLLQRTYGEEIEKKNAYQFDKNEKLTEQTKKINEDIKKLGLNNNIKTRDAIDILKKVSNETGRQYRLVNNNSTEVQTEYKKIAEKIAKMDNISMEEALKQTENLLIDGFVSDGQVFINVESNNLMRTITGHETTHLFEGTEDYKKLQKIAFKYAKTKGEYNSRRKSLEKRYRGIENAKIDNELTSDLVGDYLFTDIEFVRNLNREQPNMFQKIYNHVKHLYNMATAGSKEARQLEQLKYNFEKVYRENNQSKANAVDKIDNKSHNNLIESGDYDGKHDNRGKKGTDTNIGEGRNTSNINKQTKQSNEQVERRSTDRFGSENTLSKNQNEQGTYRIEEENIEGRNIKRVQITESKIDNEIKNYSNNKPTFIARITPNSFLKLTATDQTIHKFNKDLKKAKNEYLDINKLNSSNQPITLTVDMKTGKVLEHDGRHRMLNMLNSGVRNVDIKIIAATGTFDTNNIKSKNVFQLSPQADITDSDTKINVSDLIPFTNENKSIIREKYLTTNEELESSFSNTTKYAISNKDSDGRTLTKQQQEYFKDSKATDENGNLEVVYHGSNKAGFTVFNKNYNYYSNNKSVSQTYTGSNEMVDTKKLESISDAKSWLKGIDEYSYINGNTVYDYDGNVMLEYNTKEELLKHLKRDIQIELGNTEAGGIYEGYVDIKNPLVVNCNGDKWSAIDINGIEDNLDSLFEEFGASTFKENGAIRTTTSDITSAVSEALDEGALDYDGIIFKNIIDEGMYSNGTNEETVSDVYVTFDSNQFKAVDNTTPTNDSDIRYAISDKGELQDNKGNSVKIEASDVGNTGTLMAIHNLGENKFNGILDLGGIPVPSIAITNPEIVNHKQYGDGTLIFNKSTIDPAVKANEVYDRDVWSPTFPTVDNEIIKDNLEKVADEIGIRDYYLEDYAERNSNVEDLIYTVLREDDVVNKYLDRNNINYDKDLSRKEIRQIAIDNGINEYLKDKLKDIFGEKGIYNGKEYITSSGKRRTFWQTHDKYNLANIVKILTRKSTINGQDTSIFSGGFGNIQANMSQRFNSIQEIKNAETRLKSTADNDIKPLQDNLSNSISELTEYYGGYTSSNPFTTFSKVSEDIVDFASKKEQNISTLKEMLDEYGYKKVPDSILNDIVKSINDLKNIPTDYFEAKPQRAVGLDEIEMAVIPNNWSAETKQRLTDKGIKYTEYDPSIEGDRQRVINQYDNLKFMLSNRNDIAPISNNDIRARDMLLPRQQETQQEVEKIVAPIKEENKVLKQEVKALQKEVRDIQENSAVTQEEFEQENRRIAPLLEEQEAPPEIEQVYDNLKDTTRMPKKELKMLSKNIKDTLGLTNRQKLDLEEIIQDYSTSETATREDLYNDIKKRYGKQAIITEYEDIRNVQTKVKSMKIDVSDNIKHSIADYNKLKQKNFGKLSFSRNGQPVDSVYQELSSEYPNYFPSSIYNETDQFLRMVEVANLENKSIEEYNIDDDYVRETSDYIYDSIMDSKQDALQKAIEKTTKESLQGDLKAPLPTVFDTSSIEADNAYDEVRLMEHKARKKQKVNKTSNVSRDSGLAPYIEFAREHNLTGNDEVIETLNEADAAEENKRIEAQKKIKPQSENSIRKALTYGQYLFTNRNVEIDNYAEETGNHNIKVLADHINNIQGEISTNINDAQTDNFGKTIGKSITQIFSQADKAGLSEPFNDYLFHLSNIERHKWGKGSQVPMVDSLVLTEKYEKAYPEMKSWAKEVNKYNKNLLYKQADAGLITKELADNLSDRYEFYVPFMENLEGEYTPDSSNTIKTRSTVKRAKGGADRNLLGFEEAMINQTSSAISQIRKNQLYQEIAKTVDNATIDFDTNTNPDINNSGLMSDGKKYYLTAYVDGKATQVEIDKALYHGLAQEGNRRIRNAEQKLAPLTNPLQKASNIRRNILTTWSPSFLATNMLKDIQDAPLNSKYASDMIKNYPKALKEIATGKGEHVEAFLNMYGQGNLRGDYNLDSGLADATELVKSSSKNKGIEISKSVLKKIPQMNEVIELAPRYAEYLASLENGCSQMEALYNAREVTTNFGRGGIITKALNRNGFTFLNANVQGMSRLVRNFSGANGARGVVNSLTKVAALGIAPALFNALMYGSGDDEDKDYKALPDYIKDNYYLIKTSNNNFIRIPKGRMLSIFGSAARRTLELSQGEKDAFNGYISNAYNQVGVQNPIESNIFAPLIQAKNNKTWYGSDLVPSRLQDKPKDEQYDSSTDKFSIWLGQKTKISPYKINYVIDQYSGGIGDMILPTITEEAQSDTNSTLGTMIAPLKDKFTADSTTDNKYVSDFYTKNDEFKVKANSSKATDKDKLTNQYMKAISFEMGQLYGEMRKVQEDKKLSKSEKYRKAQNIKKEINKLAEEGLNGYSKVSKAGDYAQVGEREFYKWTNDEGETVWSKPKDEDLDKLNSLGLTIGEKSEYYKTRSKLFDVWDKYKDNYDKSKSEAIKAIRKSNMSDDAKYALYNASYNKDEEMNIAQEVGIEADAFLDYMAQTFKADKNRYGKSISGSKKAKILNYINSMNIEPEQRMILYKMQYKTNNYYNNAIVNYLNNSSLTYEEEEYILKKLGFKVSKNGNISW